MPGGLVEQLTSYIAHFVLVLDRWQIIRIKL